MSTRGNGNKKKSAESAAQPTISGQEAEDIQISESDTSPNMEDSMIEYATERVRYPCTIIDYPTYQKDLWTLARYVTQKGWYVLGNPEKFPLPPTETLRKEYLSKCMVLASLLDEEAEEVMVTFERWGVPPDSLYESPLHPDINCFYGEGKLGRNEPGPIYGYSYLEELYGLHV